MGLNQMNKQAMNDSLLLSPKFLVEVAVQLLAIWAVALSCRKNWHFQKVVQLFV